MPRWRWRSTTAESLMVSLCNAKWWLHQPSQLRKRAKSPCWAEGWNPLSRLGKVRVSWLNWYYKFIEIPFQDILGNSITKYTKWQCFLLFKRSRSWDRHHSQSFVQRCGECRQISQARRVYRENLKNVPFRPNKATKWTSLSIELDRRFQRFSLFVFSSSYFVTMGVMLSRT